MTEPRQISRVVLRPMASPLPLGLLGLAVGSLLVSGLQLEWVPEAQRNVLGFGLIGFTAVLQITAGLFSFLARDDIAAAALNVQGATHLVLGIDLLTNPAAGKSNALGLFLVLAAGAMIPPVAAGLTGKVMPALTMAAAMVHFAVDGIARFTELSAWETTAGWAGVAVAAFALYTATALILEDVADRTVLPVGRRGRGREALSGRLDDQLTGLDAEPGVREKL